MTRILQDYRLSEYMEVFILIILGMVFQIVDGSPFTLKARWKSVWEMEIPKEFFSVFAQNFIKTVLSLIVAVRCSTTYLYILSGLLVMACILTDGSPKLLLPWLLVAGVKSICLTLLETIMGMYVCSSFRRIEIACIEFIIQKAVGMLFASFLWISILNMYNTMISVVPQVSSEDFGPITQETIKKADLKKRRARSLIDESTLSKTAKLNDFEFKDVPKILMDMLKKEEELSQDSLIAQGMMLASVSNMGSFDTLKTSQSLGELGAIDLKSLQVVGLDDDNDPIEEKALKFMKLTWDDVKKAKRKRKRSLADLYNIEDSIWEKVKNNKVTINRPKIVRPEEVFVRDLHRDEEPVITGRKRRPRAKSIDSRIKPDDDLDIGEDEDESIQVGTDTTEAEEHLSRYIFMSNLKEEDKVFRIGLESTVDIRRAHKYADLYRQPHMSVIGPEVFDNACKLRKLNHVNADEEKEETVQRVIERDDEDEEKNKRKMERGLIKKKKKTIYFSDQINLVPLPSSSSIQSTATAGNDNNNDHNNSNKDNGKSDTNISAHKENSINNINHKNYSINNDDNESVNEKSNINENARGENSNNKNKNYKNNDNNSKSANGKNSKKDANGENSKKDANGENSEKDVSGENSKKDANGENSEKDANGENSEKDVSGENSKKDANGENSEKDVSGENSKTNATWESNKKKSVNGKNESTYIDSQQSGESKKVSEIKLPLDEEKEHFENKLLPPHAEKETEVQKKALNNPPQDDPSTSEKRIRVLIRRYSNNPEKFENVNDGKRIEIKVRKLSDRDRKDSKINMNKQIYYTTDFMHQPVSTCLKMAYERNLKSSRFKLSKAMNKKYKIEKHSKKWKSSVLKNVAELQDDDGLLKSQENITQFYPVLPSETVEKLEIFNKKPENINTEPYLPVDSSCLHNMSPPPEENDSYKYIEQNSSQCSLKSNESFSLYYSKAANLASPLFDVRRFIYPDRIHYSYQNMKNKEGFDVEISGELPLIVRESLTFNPYKAEKPLLLPESRTGITRRPMDLSFAFFDQNDESYGTPEAILSEQDLDGDSAQDLVSVSSSCDAESQEDEQAEQIYNKIIKLNSRKAYSLIQKILKICLHKHEKSELLESDCKDQ